MKSVVLMKVRLSRQIFENYSNIKFHENHFSGFRVAPWLGRKGRHDKKIIVFRNFANAHKILRFQNSRHTI